MMRLSPSHTAFTLLLALLLGCGADQAPAESAAATNQEASDPAEAAGGGGTVGRSAIPAPFDPSGEWQGLLGCAGRDFPLQLSVAADGSARVTLTPAINRPNTVSPDGRQKIEALPLTGTAHPAARVIQFVEAEAPSRPLTFSLLVSPDDRTALLRHGRCEYGIAQRGTTDAIDAMQQELQIISEQVVLDASEMGKACPDNLERWIAVGEALPLDGWARGDISTLWAPELITEVFGKPLDAIGAAERRQIRQLLQARCAQSDNRRRRALISRLALLTDYRSFRTGLFTRHQRPIIKDWLRYTDEALLSSRYIVTSEGASMVSGVPVRFRFDDLIGSEPGYDKASIYQRLQPLVQRAKLADRANELVAALERSGDSFFRLTSIYASAAADPDLDQQRLLDTYQQQLPGAAGSYADAAQDARSARRMKEWLGGQEAVCPAPAATACSAAARHFEQRLPALLKTLADAEADALETLEDLAETPAGLESRVESDRQFALRYQGLLEDGPLAELARERREARQRLQNRLQKALIAQVEQTNSTVALARLESAWFLDEDLERRNARPFLNAVSQQRANQQPFSGTAGEYLNALYNRDTATLTRLDRRTTQAVQPMLSLMAQQMDTMSVLGDGLLQLLGGDTSSSPGVFSTVARELRNPSAIKAVAMRYLLHYEQVYAECLGPNAREFVFSERVDTVTKSASGLVLNRIEGVTTQTSYRVKPELSGLFQQAFSRPADASSDALYRALFNDDSLERLLSGVSNTMRERACTDPEMLRLEQGMISYLSNRQRFWRSGR